MPLSDAVTIPDDVLARQVGQETVILDLASGRYFGLDPVGAHIWRLLTEGHTPAQACDRLLEEYEVGREELERDVGRLVDELLAQGLLKPA